MPHGGAPRQENWDDQVRNANSNAMPLSTNIPDVCCGYCDVYGRPVPADH